MADDKPTDYGSWITVREAIDRAAKHFDLTDGFRALWPRIRDGLIPTCTMRSAVKTGMSGTPTTRLEPRSISPRDWTQYNEHPPKSLYRDEVTFLIRGNPGYGTDRYVTCYDVRLDPEAVDREFPKPTRQDSPAPAPFPLDPEYEERLVAAVKAVQPAIPEPEASEDREPVDRKDLEAWYALYVQTYGDGLPLPHAVDSAKGFFHDKTVGRDRVHALFPARKSGRKPSTDK